MSVPYSSKYNEMIRDFPISCFSVLGLNTAYFHRVGLHVLWGKLRVRKNSQHLLDIILPLFLSDFANLPLAFACRRQTLSENEPFVSHL